METARTKNLRESVRYLGSRRLEDLVTEIDNCDLGVIPNHRNTFTAVSYTHLLPVLAMVPAIEISVAPKSKHSVIQKPDETSIEVGARA